VSGSRENLPQLPDSAFQPPMPMNIAEKWVKERLEATSPGRKLIHTRLSNMTEDKPAQGRTKCQFRNQCGRGCSFGAYFSTQAVTLPAARATGRLTLRPDAVVTNLEYDPKPEEGHRRPRRRREDQAGRSDPRPPRLPLRLGDGVDPDPDELADPGRQELFRQQRHAGPLRDGPHLPRRTSAGDIPGMTEFIEYGRRPGGVYIPRFRNVGGEEGVGFRRGYGYQGGARREPGCAARLRRIDEAGHAPIWRLEVRHGRVRRMPAL
jgi:hypothetical protein